MRNVRIVQRLVALAFGLPFHAVNRQMTPMLVLQFSERCQDATKLQFRRVNGHLHLPKLRAALDAHFTKNVSAARNDQIVNAA